MDIHGNPHEVPVSALRWRPSAYAIIINEGQVLLVPTFGGYSLPGGGLELGDSIETALAREVAEETGISVEVADLVGAESNFFVLPGVSEKGNHVQSILMFYKCEHMGGELRAENSSDETIAFGGMPEWVSLSKLSDISIAGSVDWRKYIAKVAG